MLRQWRQWRREHERAFAQAAAVAPTVFISICLVAFVGMIVATGVYGQISYTRTHGSGASAAPFPTNTPLPTATQTPTSPLDHGPYLGSNGDVFHQLMHVHADDPGRSPSFITIAGQEFDIKLWGGVPGSPVGESDLQATNSNLNAQTAPAIMKTFLPPDARYVRTETRDASFGGTVVHHVYTSALLAKAIDDPHDYFDDLDFSTPIPVGTFEWYCYSTYGYLNGPYDYCYIWTRAPAV